IEILENNREKLTQLANHLLDKEVIFKEDLEIIFGKRPFAKDIEEAEAELIEEKKNEVVEPVATENNVPPTPPIEPIA
ncbi:MAG: hypothetical protein ACRCYO_01760, partial [Bacteroidia bacterium]